MALRNNFYNEIFEQEQKWIELVNNNLLNSIYCNLVLKPFYVERKKELESEYKLAKNIIIGQVLEIMNKIIKKIELFDVQYKNFENCDISSLIPLFLTNQMNNSVQKENNSTNVEDMDVLQIRKEILEDKIRELRNIPIEDQEDYLYDDFPEERRKVK